MEKKQLYFVRDDTRDPERLLWNADYFTHTREAPPEEVTLEMLADMFDLHAENINAHDFVSTHRALAALLHQRVGRAQATQIFLALVDFEGLHGLTGVCGRTDPAEHEQVLGVPLNSWKEWTLS